MWHYQRVPEPLEQLITREAETHYWQRCPEALEQLIKREAEKHYYTDRSLEEWKTAMRRVAEAAIRLQEKT